MATPASPYPRPRPESLAAFNQLLKAKRWLVAAMGSVVVVWLLTNASVQYFDYTHSIPPPLGATQLPLFEYFVMVGGLFSSVLWGWAAGRYAKSMGFLTSVIGFVGFVIAFLEINGQERHYEWPPSPENPLYTSHLLLWAIYFALQFHINRQLKVQFNLNQVWFFRSPKEIRAIRTRLAAEEAASTPALHKDFAETAP